MVEQLKILMGSPNVVRKMKGKIKRQLRRIEEENKV